jgi:hypothetical protein
MMKIDKKIIKEIAENLDCGMNCFLHKTTLEIIEVPDEYFEAEIPEEWQEEIDKIDENPDDYVRFEKPSSYESFEFMKSFIDILPEDKEGIKFANQLVECLNRNHPFRRFKEAVDNSDYRDAWFAHKQACLEEYVKGVLELE